MVIPCSTQASAEPLAGSAPQTLAWVAVEHPGPWGARAVADRFPGLTEVPGVRFLLIRRGYRQESDARIFVSVPGQRVLTISRVENLDELRTWDLSAIIRGSVPGTPTPEDPILICTNGARDRCCATLGRALLDSTTMPVWQCTHVGGHRFAPVVVRLRDGFVFGRVTSDDLVRIAAGETPVRCARGRAELEPAQQAAELAVIERGGGVGDHSLDPTDPSVMLVRTSERTWRVRVRQTPASHERSESCGGELRPMNSWLVDVLE